jgi:hypothetical protein
MKFLTALLTLAGRILAAWSEHKRHQQGRQEAIREANDELKRKTDLAESAAQLDDPDRTKRLRARFDAAASD